MTVSSIAGRNVPGEMSLKASTHKMPMVTARWSRKVAVDIVALLDVVSIVIGAFLPVTIYSTFGGMSPNIILAIQSSLAAAVIAVLLLKAWGMYDTRRVHDLPEKP